MYGMHRISISTFWYVCRKRFEIESINPQNKDFFKSTVCCTKRACGDSFSKSLNLVQLLLLFSVLFVARQRAAGAATAAAVFPEVCFARAVALRRHVKAGLLVVLYYDY
jgi:hypothetical protein